MEEDVLLKDLEILANLEQLLKISIEEVNQIWWEETTKWGEKSLKHHAGYVIENEQIVELSLFGFRLSNLPNEIGELTQLRKLNLSNNNLNSLTESFTNLKSLQIIDLSWNQFKILPEFIGELNSLIKIDLQYNRLSSLPDSIGNLRFLKVLNLTDNPLTELPESIGQLMNLEEISLENCHLNYLPSSIGHLKDLKSMNLSWNRLNNLPNSFENLLNLNNLSLVKNLFTEFPKVITGLNSLNYLNIMRNKIKNLPESIGLLKNLIELNMQNNALISLPNSFGQMESLKELSLRENSLNSLPDSFGQLKKLEILNLRVNQLNWLPESLAQLKNLVHLNLESNNFTSIPPQLWGLESLKELILLYNPLIKEDREMLERNMDEILEYCRIRANLHIFLSYKIDDPDFERSQIEALAQNLEERDEIYKVIYCERDMRGNIDEFMRENVPKCQLLLFIATDASINSKDCQTELELARNNNLRIVPIKGQKLGWNELAKLDLNRVLGFPFSTDNFNGLCDMLYNYFWEYKRVVDFFRRDSIEVNTELDKMKNTILDHIESENFKSYIQKNFKIISEQFGDLEYKSKEQLEQIISLLKSFIDLDRVNLSKKKYE